jgi:ComEC/Rec2-related protein
MSDAALRRPLSLLLLAYMAALAWLRASGRLAPAAVCGRARETVMPLLADRPAKEDLRGWKSQAQAEGLRVEVRWPRGAELSALPLPGDRALVEGKLRPPRPARNPGDFDEAAFLADRGVSAVLEAKGYRVLPDAPPARLRAARLGERLRRSVHARLFSALPPERARLAEGLALGYKGALPAARARAVRDAGLIHLIVPSGAKVALAFCAALLLSKALRLPPWAAWLAAAGLGGAVTLAAGAEPPYARAYLAGLALLGARALGREGDAFQALVASAWVLLVADPRCLFSAGFQMTYLALLGILSLWPPAGLPRWAAALWVSAAVQAALWPVFACVFGRASLVGLAANAAAVPAYPLLAGGAWVVWGASFLGARAAGLAAAPVSWTLGGFEVCCEKAAALPWAATALSPWAGTTVAAYYLLLVGLPRPRRSAPVLLFAAALATGSAAWRRFSAPPVRMVVLSVPPLAHRRRHAAFVQFNGGPALFMGEAPKSLEERAARALGLTAARSTTHLFPIRLGNAKISPFQRSAAEVTTDGVEVHIGSPR